jgi:hypothetical protein
MTLLSEGSDMTCPICDQKPMNCDCTETEKRQWSEIEDLRLTDEEREAIEWFAEVRKPLTRLTQSHNREKYKDTLRGLMERLK